MKTTTLIIAILTACIFHPTSLSASDAIRPYKETGKSGQFSYAVYNNQWLLHGQQAINEKHLTRVAITGVLPAAKGKIVIPAAINGHEVYGIDDKALESCMDVTSLVIPKTVRFLKPNTLNRCRDLENIVIAADHPDFASVDGVMFDKQKTKLLALGAGRRGRYVIPANTTAIGPYAFSLCTHLTSVIIPKGLTDIGGRTGGVFQGCSGLQSIDIPESVTNIGQKSFQDCSSLTQIIIPPNVTEIPFGLFWKCSNLNAVTLPDTITKIGNYAFAECTKLTLKKFPKNLTTVGAYAFKNCKSLKGFSIPKSVTKIDRGAFKGSGLETFQ